MTYTEACDYIASLRTAGMQMGLERMERGVEALGHPERAFHSVHIAGTNGKGSTAYMIAAMLQSGGYSVGRYTSPYLTTYRDMLWIDGELLSEEAFAACTDIVRNAVPTGLSEYECLTLIAFEAFRRRGVRIAVIECCLGGLTDATNVIPAPLCAVFTPIARDHTAILGETVEEITLQKSGIAKPPCDIVCAPSMDEGALGIVYEKAALGGQRIYQPSFPAEPPNVTASGTHFVWNRRDVSLRMLGAHQAENALTALQTIQCLCRHGYAVEDDTAVAALQAVTLPCRQELVSDDPWILLDGAHNPHGIRALTTLLQQLDRTPVTLVIGMLSDKDADQCLSMLTPFCEQILCCTPPNTARALAAYRLAAVARRYHDSVTVCDDPIQALENAKKATRHPIVVGGSFYTAKAVRQALLSQNT